MKHSGYKNTLAGPVIIGLAMFFAINMLFPAQCISGNGSRGRLILRSGAGWYLELADKLDSITRGVDANIGIALIVDGKDTITVNNSSDYHLFSVMKFPQAIACALLLKDTEEGFGRTVAVKESDMKGGTWSPLRDGWKGGDGEMSVSELLECTLQRSDNIACDILFERVASPASVQEMMNRLGYGISIQATEEEMNADDDVISRNHASPLEVARLFSDMFSGRLGRSKELQEVANIMQRCDTGADRIAAGLGESDALIWHKTGTGGVREGRLQAVNDAAYVRLGNGRSYSLAVFINDAAMTGDSASRLIADISGIISSSLAGRN